MKTIKQLLDDKGHDVWTINPGASIYDAIALMAEKEVGALMVVDGDNPVGVISERDYARKVILKGRSSTDTQIQEIMTRDIIFAEPVQTVEQCLALMTEKRIRHLPVMDNGTLQGMVSIGDLVKEIINELRFTVQQLEQYISG